MNTTGNVQTEELTEKEMRRAAEAAGETRSAAFRAAAIWIPVGPILCIVLLRVLKEALITAQELASEQAGFPTEPFMPLVLLAGLGACYGAFVAWRVINSSGAVGAPVFMAVGVCMFATFIGGAIGALVIFDAGVPAFAWAGVGATVLVGMGTAWLVNLALG